MKFRMTFEKMEGFSFVTPVTVLNRPNTGKEDDDEKSNEMPISKQNFFWTTEMRGTLLLEHLT
jgi:hypothetical protein